MLGALIVAVRMMAQKYGGGHCLKNTYAVNDSQNKANPS